MREKKNANTIENVLHLVDVVIQIGGNAILFQLNSVLHYAPWVQNVIHFLLVDCPKWTDYSVTLPVMQI